VGGAHPAMSTPFPEPYPPMEQSIYAVARICYWRYTSMTWEVEYTDEFGKWWAPLDSAEQNSIDVVVRILEERGPHLPFPFSSGVEASRHSHMRELRVQHRGNQ
jgi:hypothetical protein